MDLASIIGIVTGFVLVIFGIVFDGNQVDFLIIVGFLNWPSVLITLGGSITSVLTSNSIRDFVNGLKGIRFAFKAPDMNIESSIKKVCAFRPIW